MTEVKLTKNELRSQQTRLGQLEKYLPTLQLKKAMLQVEVYNARQEMKKQQSELARLTDQVEAFRPLLEENLSFSIEEAAEIKEVHRRHENIAGVEIPIFESVVFGKVSYELFDTPPWVDAAIIKLQKKATAAAEVEIAKDKVRALENELREVSIRVNLFEKVLIPRAQQNIKKIKVFLGDQQLAAVGQAKAAKSKIIKRKALSGGHRAA